MPQRGFFTLQIWLLIGGAVALLAAFGGYSVWLYNAGGSAARSEQEAATAKEKAARVQMISDLALELSKRGALLAEERLKREREVREARGKREGRAHEFIPPVPGSDTCIRVGFVRYTNAAATGMPLDARPAPGVAEAPAGIGTVDVARTVARNYDKYHDCKGTLADTFEDFDTKREAFNRKVNEINKRVREQQ